MGIRSFRGGGSSTDITSDLSNVPDVGRILYAAVVVNFISNPVVDLEKAPLKDSTFSTYAESLRSGYDKVSNTELIGRMPRNSVIGRVISDRDGWGGKSEIFYPFFPHISFPVKPGEQIWVIYDTLSRGKSRKGFWLTRIASDNYVDDLNYTQKNRESLYLDAVTSTDSALANQEESFSFTEEEAFVFPSGGGLTISSNDMSGADAYGDIVAYSNTYADQFVGEPVPRFSKRVGDLVLQGSNNTSIVLGMDRVGEADTPPGTEETIGESMEGVTGFGTIDIVAGRGQDAATAAVDNSDLGAVTNTREWDEINKFPSVTDEESNPAEGDPDFENDLSRIYVSMQTNGDENFDLEFTNSTASVVDEAPYVIAKSTEVRLVARDGGSVRMVKEGDEQCEICLMSDGTISIEGGTIYLGEHSSDNTTEPVVLGELLATAFEDFADECTGVIPGILGNFGAPIVDPGLAAAISTLATDVRAALSTMVYTK